MEILLKRRLSADSSFTMGRLSIGDSFRCSSLEPPSRGLSLPVSAEVVRAAKLGGLMAIPAGSYKVELLPSPRFSCRAFYKQFAGLLPRLSAVPSFSGILIHCGNTIADTSGCILIGEEVRPGLLGSSRRAFERLMRCCLLPAHERGENIAIRIVE